MMRKRLLCAALALAMLFSLQPAAAAAQFPYTNITAKTRLPTINVTVPSKGSVYLNPLKLKVGVRGDYTDQQIICPAYSLISRSNVALDVDVTVSGSVGATSNMELVPYSTEGSGSTNKEAFIYFEIQPNNSDDPEAAEWDDTYDSNSNNQICLYNAEDGITKQNVLRLEPLTSDGDVSEGGYAAFRLMGDAVETPDSPWSSKDGIDVLVTFTFTPIAFEK